MQTFEMEDINKWEKKYNRMMNLNIFCMSDNRQKKQPSRQTDIRIGSYQWGKICSAIMNMSLIFAFKTLSIDWAES